MVTEGELRVRGGLVSDAAGGGVFIHDLTSKGNTSLHTVIIDTLVVRRINTTGTFAISGQADMKLTATKTLSSENANISGNIYAGGETVTGSLSVARGVDVDGSMRVGGNFTIGVNATARPTLDVMRCGRWWWWCWSWCW